MKKLVTLLVALAMVLTLGTAAMAADMGTGVEGDPYVYYGAPEAFDVVPAGGSIYCNVFGVAGTILTINDADAYVIHNGVTYEAVDGVVTAPLSAGMPMVPVSLVIGNKGAEDKAFACSFALPEGDMSNPVMLEGEFANETVALAEGDDNGYFYQWTAVGSGMLELEIYDVIAADGVVADIVVSNQNTYAQRSLSADGVVNDWGASVLQLEVTEGDVLSIQVVVAPDANWIYPAAEITWGFAFSYPQGSEMNPILLFPEPNEAGNEMSLTFTAPAGTTYYGVFAAGMFISIDGSEPVLVPQNMGRMPYVFCITGDAETEHTIVLTYPVGSFGAPEVIPGLGEFTCSVPEGGSGYYYNFTATADGTLYFILDEVSGVAADLVDISVYNLNSYESKGLWEYDDMGNASTTGYVAIKVTAGDELQIMVNTLPDENWTYSAANVTFTVSNEAPSSDETGDMIGVVVAMLAVSGMGITVLKKKEF